MEKIDHFLKNYDAGKVLDLATGPGNFLSFIFECKSYENITALDSMEVFKPLFEKNFADKKVTFVVGDVYDLPYEDNSFDTVCLSNSLHHFENPEKALQEMYRVVNKNGKIIINEMFSDDLSAAQESHKKLHHLAAEQDRILQRFHADTYTKKTLIQLAKLLPLKEIQLIDYTYPIPDVFDKEMLDRIFTTLDKMEERIKNRDKLQTLLCKLDKIRAYIKENGYASASSIFFVGEK